MGRINECNHEFHKRHSLANAKHHFLKKKLFELSVGKNNIIQINSRNRRIIHKF